MQPPHAHVVVASAPRAAISRHSLFHSSIASAHLPHRLAGLPNPAAAPHPKPTPTGMDPDQVADAGVQHDDGGSGDSWARALLLRGWDLSRKAAIAGVVATAAPVVAPPLLVLSLAGVALSLPFAAYLASLAATDRLMGALLPAPRTQLYHACDLEDDEFLDASEAPAGEAPVFDHWRDAENDAITEENESFVSLPLSRGPRFSEELMPPGGEFLFRELGHESLVLDNKEQEHEQEDTTMEDIEFVTTEAPPRGSDVFGSAVPVLRGEDNMVQRVVQAPLTAKESVQDFSVSDNENGTEDGKVHKTKEEIPLQEANVSESSVVGDTIMLERKIEGDVTVEMMVKEVSINTNPSTGEVAGEQVGSIATALPESESLQASNLVAQEFQATVEVENVDDVVNAALTEDVVLDIGDTSTEGMEHYGVSSVVSVVTVDDVAEIVSSRSPAVSGISDDMKSVKSKPDADRSNQRTGYALRNKEFSEEEITEDKRVKTEETKTMDDKVPTRSMTPQVTDVSKSPVPDDKSKIEDDITVETVLEGVTSDAGDLVTREVVAVQLNINASESESPSVSDHLAQEVQAVSEAAVVDEIQGSAVIEDRGTCSFVSGVLVATVNDSKDVVSSRRTPHASARDSASSVEGTLVSDNPHQTTGVEYKPVNKGLGRDVVAEDMENYTEEQLREQLDTLRTITGYRPAPSLTLEAELVGLYVFVGVEPPVSSRDASDLNDLNTKLRFLKSIIGVE